MLFLGRYIVCGYLHPWREGFAQQPMLAVQLTGTPLKPGCTASCEHALTWQLIRHKSGILKCSVIGDAHLTHMSLSLQTLHEL